MKLIKATPKMKTEIEKFKIEYLASGEKTINGGELLDKIDSIDEWFNYIKKNSNKSTVSEDWVVTDVYFGVVNDKIIGVISLHHTLNDFLEDFGHIGYSILPKQRNKGYGTIILKEVLKKAREIGLNEVQISAYNDNIASIKIIGKNNGKLIRIVKYLDKIINVYKIKL